MGRALQPACAMLRAGKLSGGILDAVCTALRVGVGCSRAACHNWCGGTARSPGATVRRARLRPRPLLRVGAGDPRSAGQHLVVGPMRSMVLSGCWGNRRVLEARSSRPRETARQAKLQCRDSNNRPDGPPHRPTLTRTKNSFLVCFHPWVISTVLMTDANAWCCSVAERQRNLGYEVLAPS